MLTILITLALGCGIVFVGMHLGRGLVCLWYTLLIVRYSWRRGAR